VDVLDSRYARWIALLCVLAVAGFILVPYDMLDFIPATIGPFGPIPQVDFAPIARFGAFLVIGAVSTLGFPSWRWTLVLVLILSIAALEVVQSLLPGRHGRFDDFAVKASGTIMGAAAVALGRMLTLKALR
jgi:hypothetical protein